MASCASPSIAGPNPVAISAMPIVNSDRSSSGADRRRENKSRRTKKSKRLDNSFSEGSQRFLVLDGKCRADNCGEQEKGRGGQERRLPKLAPVWTAGVATGTTAADKIVPSASTGVGSTCSRPPTTIAPAMAVTAIRSSSLGAKLVVAVMCLGCMKNGTKKRTASTPRSRRSHATTTNISSPIPANRRDGER